LSADLKEDRRVDVFLDVGVRSDVAGVAEMTALAHQAAGRPMR
jgi:hypothetical protein